MEIPKKLYKYQAYNHYSLANLKNNHIYFNSALNFNDPYDCLHAIEYQKLSDKLTQEIYLKSSPNARMKSLVEELFSHSISAESLIEFYKAFIQDNPDLAQKLHFSLGIDPGQYFLDLEQMILHGGHFNLLKKTAIDALTEKVNLSVRKGIEDIRRNMASKHGISCFSEVYANMLMWSYYADGHKGYCLEFDSSEEPFNKPKKVEYVEEIPPFDPAILLDEGNSTGDVIQTFLVTKYKGWSHEREWRVIHQETSKLFCYKSKALTGIYFGTKIDPTTLEILLVILKAQNPHVKFYRMEKIAQEFRLVARDLEYMTHLEGQNIFLEKLKKSYGTGMFSLEDVIKMNGIGIPANLVSVYLDNLEALNLISKEGQHFTFVKTSI